MAYIPGRSGSKYEGQGQDNGREGEAACVALHESKQHGSKPSCSHTPHSKSNVW